MNTIFHWACPRVPSEIFLAKYSFRSFLHENWQQWAWCDVEFTDTRPGHEPYKVSRDRGYGVGLFRRPQQRVMSAYAAGLHHYGMRDPIEMKRSVLKAAHDQGPLESLRVYTSWPGISSCQTKMILGYKCASNEIELQPEDLMRAMEIVERDFLFVGITEDFDRSVCLFHAMLGGQTNPNEFRNVRPTSGIKQSDEIGDSADVMIRKINGTYDETYLDQINYSDLYDESLYAHVKQLFYKRAAMFDLEPCMQIAASSHNL